MRHQTVTPTLATPPDELFAYLADIEKLPEWATEFAREQRLVDGRHKVVNGQGEFKTVGDETPELRIRSRDGPRIG